MIKVCIMDQDLEFSSSLEQMLSAWGYQVNCISHFIGASNAIRKFNPDLLVVDVVMSAISETSLVDVLKKNLAHLPILILYSNLDEEQLSELARRTGADDYIRKDEDFLKFVSLLRYCVEKQAVQKAMG